MLEINDLFDGRSRIEKVLGSGGMGKVFLAEDVTDKTKWAIKEQRITPGNRELLYYEADIMEKVVHPAFPRLRSRKEKNGVLYIVMEYINGDTLTQVIREQGQLPEEQVLSWFRQIADALAYLHGLDTPIVYRDFKPSNLMLEKSGRVRIIDLGIAQEYSSDTGATVDAIALTRGYAAPEQYNKRYKLDSRTDIYALGVTMHYLITGNNPNKPPYEFVPIRKLRPDASPALEAVIKKCIQPNPDHRYASASQLCYELEHIDELAAQIRSRGRLRVILAATAAALAITVAAIFYVVNLNAQTARANEYYAYIESARSAETLEEALKNTQAAIDLSPDNPEAYLVHAEKYAEFGRPEEALAYIRETIVPRYPDIYSDTDFLSLIARLESSQ